MAYFSCTVGAGFASGQEMLQYYAAFGWWGVAGAVIALVLMPIAATIAMQYGSYFQATSHDRVFSSVTSKLMAKFVDYSIVFTQFCIAFVMLSGAGANLNQQWGLPNWVGASLMAAFVIDCAYLNVQKVTRILSAITPFVVAVMVAAIVYSFLNMPADLGANAEFAQANIESSPPNWWVSTFNYVGIALMTSISMSIIMGGDVLDVKAAGRGGLFGGLLFGVLLVLLVASMILNVEQVYDSPLPTLAIIQEMSPLLATISAVLIYLMIFSTALGNFYSLGLRVSSRRPKMFRPALFIIVAVGIVLSFVDFATLVGTVFPIMGYVALVMIAVLLITWFGRGRNIVQEEARRRDRIRALVLNKVNPRKPFAAEEETALSDAITDSNLHPAELREAVAAELNE